jgi:uncharacterized lipoprotein YajG
MRLFFMFISLLVSLNTFAQDVLKIGEVENFIKLGPYAGNRDLAFGVQNILEEVIQDKGYDLSPKSTTEIKVELLYFDVKKTNVQLAIYGKNTEATEIIAKAYLIVDGKKKKPVVAKGTAKSISTATLIIDKGGKFSQTDVSTALKKVCVELIEKLKL